VIDWVRRVAALGAGKSCSPAWTGTARAWFDLALTRRVSEAIEIPVIASGGVGTLQHLADGVVEGKADAVLAAAFFTMANSRCGRPSSSCGIRYRDATMSTNWLNEVKWDEQGLVPVIAQDANTGEVLMFAWMNRDALEQTAQRGEAVYWSRSRRKLWHKGEESGHIQKVIEIRADCDSDVVLLKVEQTGGIACHTGAAVVSSTSWKAAAGRMWSRY